MINSKFIFQFEDALYLETLNDEDARFTYLDPLSYQQMKIIWQVARESKIHVQVFDDLVLIINQNLNCLMFTKTKELEFELNRDMIDVILTERTQNGLLIVCHAYRNGNPGFLSSSLWCRRPQEDAIIKIMNVQLKDGYQDVEPRSVLDVLSLRNQENRDAITTIETIKEVSLHFYIIFRPTQSKYYLMEESSWLLMESGLSNLN